MKVLLLAGGLGTRLSEETDVRPKPMVEIGGKPILWHIMNLYAHHGFREFVVLLGYKSYFIKEYFANYFLHQNDVTIDLSDGSMEILNNASEPWKVTLLETGLHSMTGSRIKQAQPHVGDSPFMVTYGDGVANIDIKELVNFHKGHGAHATMTSAIPEARFGVLKIEDDNNVSKFLEKPKEDAGWINAGFFVCQPEVFDYIDNSPDCIFERDPLEQLAASGNLFTYKHQGYWQCMDTLRDKIKLNELWDSGDAPWRVWG
jgi:glucose-1-phosphate cytidylyltransferase